MSIPNFQLLISGFHVCETEETVDLRMSWLALFPEVDASALLNCCPPGHPEGQGGRKQMLNPELPQVRCLRVQMGDADLR